MRSAMAAQRRGSVKDSLKAIATLASWIASTRVTTDNGRFCVVNWRRVQWLATLRSWPMRGQRHAARTSSMAAGRELGGQPVFGSSTRRDSDATTYQ
jgi:hypothetical protein